MPDIERIRSGVRASLPELADFADQDLAEKIVEAWTLSLSQTEFESIEDMPGSANPDSPSLRGGTQATHIRGVGQLTVALGEELERVLGPLGLDRDMLYAGGVLHDLGKPFENSRINQKRWQDDPGKTGFPSIRHSVYGVHIALTVGLPESLAHVCGAHSGEGELIYRSLLNSIVHHADHAFWAAAEKGGLLDMNPRDRLSKKG
ncbi:HD domain-containing protein [Paenarthrobacter sp. RAF54_2]|uniref:HD domain-containing protein n=1 Tax=Paenarthrobacter sp. RAF54_2 TaxID=3233061 RepID=UPI003F9ACE27